MDWLETAPMQASIGTYMHGTTAMSMVKAEAGASQESPSPSSGSSHREAAKQARAAIQQSSPDRKIFGSISLGMAVDGSGVNIRLQTPMDDK